MKQFILVLLFLWQCFAAAHSIAASDADVLWNDAQDMARQGESDFAFVDLRTLADSYPDFRQSSAVMFSLGEYHFARKDLASAARGFEVLCSKYPKSREAAPALAYLYKIAQLNGQAELMARYQKDIVLSQPLVLVFKESKSLEYFSGFRHKYKIIFYIDRVEAWVDGKLFVAIPA